MLIKAKGKCTTDHISMAGPWLKFRCVAAQRPCHSEALASMRLKRCCPLGKHI